MNPGVWSLPHELVKTRNWLVREWLMRRLAWAVLILGLAAAFYGFAGVSASSLAAAQALFVVCLGGFVMILAHIASLTGRAHR